MSALIRRIALLSAALAIAAPCAAQGSAAPTALEKRVSLDLKAMAPRDAFNVIASAIGYTVDVAPDVSTPVDIVVGNISAKTALNTICESIGCAWQARGTVIRVTKVMTTRIERRTPAAQRDQARGAAMAAEIRRRMEQLLPADMKFENAPMSQVVERLRQATGFEIALSEAGRPGQSFTGDLSNRPFSAAIRTISEQFHGNLIITMIGPFRTERGTTARISFRIQAKK